MSASQWLKSLPVPTVEQTVQFAEHVADNHSWYKHLPFFPPGSSFVFFPNLHAGRGVKWEGDRCVVHDIDESDYFDHHSGLSTTDYRARFGHWDYWAGGDPRMKDQKPGPWLHSAEGDDRQLLPDDLKRQWSCRLTAFLKVSPAMFRMEPHARIPEAAEFLRARRRWWKWKRDQAEERYRPLAEHLQQPDSDWDLKILLDFALSEVEVQRQKMLVTLHHVRKIWSESRSGQ